MKQSLCTFFILWAGIIIGLSFIATPAKFFTPNISKVIALSVGKTTFTIFNKIEWAIFIASVLVAYNVRLPYQWIFLSVIFVVMLLQTLWLLPALSIKVDSISSGIANAKTYHHLLYIVLEFFKTTALLTYGIYTNFTCKLKY